MISKNLKKTCLVFLVVLLGIGIFWGAKCFNGTSSSQKLNAVEPTVTKEPNTDLVEYKNSLILGSTEKYSDDMRAILERGELLVGVLSIENEPFVIKESNGEFKGYCIDFAKYLANKLGVRLKIDDSAETYDDLIRMAHSKKVDIALGNLGKTEQRATGGGIN